MSCTPPEELVGYGTIFQYKNPLTDEWTTIAGTKDLTIPDRTRGELETTTGSSGRWRKFRPGILKEQAPVTYEMNFLKAQWFVLNAMVNDDVVYEWRLVHMGDPEQFFYQYCGFVTSLTDGFPMEELVTSSITIRPSGAPSWGNLV